MNWFLFTNKIISIKIIYYNDESHFEVQEEIEIEKKTVKEGRLI